MIEVRLRDGSTVEVELTEDEWVALLDFSRRGINIYIPLGRGYLVFENINNLSRVLRTDPDDLNMVELMRLALRDSKPKGGENDGH